VGPLITALFLVAAPVSADSLQELSLITNDLVYDPASGLILASVPGRAGAGGRSIVRIDPVSAEIVGSVPIDGDPGRLALTEGGQYLYVALNGAYSVRRYELPALTPGPQFSVQGSVTRLETLPGLPQSVIVSVNGGPTAGPGVYDDGVPRTFQSTIRPDPYGEILPSLSPRRFYAPNFGWLARFAAGTTRFWDLELPNSQTVALSDAGNQFQRGLIFDASGAVIDPEARQRLGTFANDDSDGQVVCPDLPNGRVYMLAKLYTNQLALRAFDARTFIQVGSTPLPTVVNYPYAQSFIRWGTDGLAFHTGQRIYILRSSLVAQDARSVDLQVSGSALPSVAAGGLSTLTLSIRNEGQRDATFASLTETLPETAIVEAAVASQGAVYASGGVVTARLGNLAVGQSATVTVSVRFATAGTAEYTAQATAFERDLDPTNDALTGTVAVGASPQAELGATWGALRVTCPPRGKCHYSGKLTVRNQGGQAAKRFTVRFYRSEYPWLNAGAVKLSEVKVAKLAGGKSTVAKLNVKALGAAPHYYVLAEVDAGQVVPEANELDNQTAFAKLTVFDTKRP
jgi:hypothetical protein